MWSEMSSKSSHHFHSPFDGDIYLGGSDTAVLMGKALENDPLLQEARSALDPLNSAEGMPAGCAKFSWRMPGLQSLRSGFRAQCLGSQGLGPQDFSAKILRLCGFGYFRARVEDFGVVHSATVRVSSKMGASTLSRRSGVTPLMQTRTTILARRTARGFRAQGLSPLDVH